MSDEMIDKIWACEIHDINGEFYNSWDNFKNPEWSVEYTRTDLTYPKDQAEAAIEALRELVELKNMKETLGFASGPEPVRWDYYERKPLAWEAARKAISALQENG